MNSKTVLKILIPVLAVLLLVPLLLVGGNRLIYGRSLSATFFEWELRSAGRDSMTEGAEAWLAQNTADNAGECRIPVDLETPYQSAFYGDMKYYLFTPEAACDTVLLYFPGGTFIDKPLVSHWYFIDRLAQDTGCRIIVPIYPKLPDYTAAEAYAVLTDFYADCVAPLADSRLLFMGDSSGGGMALALAQLLAADGIAGPDELILLSPWLDVSMQNDDMEAYESRDPKLDRETLRYAGSLWAGDGSVTEAPASPLYGELQGLCPITLYIGTRELLYPDALRFAERAETAGCELTLVVGRGMNHIWPIFQCYGVKEAVSALQNIESIILSE